MVPYLISTIRRKYSTFTRIMESDPEERVALLGQYLRKALWFAFLPVTLSLALALRMMLRLLEPVIQIRFGRFWSFAPGVWLIPTEIYLCQRDAGMLPNQVVDIFYHHDRNRSELKPEVRRRALICNQQLDKMFHSHLRIWNWTQFLDQLNRALPCGSEDFIVQMPEPYDRYGLLDRFPSHLVFTEEEERRGQERLREFGIEPGAPFVCFHARDEAWLTEGRPRLVSVYGHWAPQYYRNASIGNYLSAAEKLAELGYYAIRMGKCVEGPLQSNNPRVLDYGYRFQSDFMDAYLSARCAFFVGQNSGMTSFPMVFRTPTAFVNIFPLTEMVVSGGAKDIFIPKKYYSKKKGRLLTFCEILSNPILASTFRARHFDDPDIRDNIDLEIQENTPEEISALAMEQHQRLCSAFAPTPGDEEMQRCFLSIVRSHVAVFPPFENFERCRIGAHFLRSHPELLD